MKTRDDTTWIEIPYTKIGSIKTKRSVGNSIAIGSGIGGITGGTFFALLFNEVNRDLGGQPESSSTIAAFTAGFVLGGVEGTIVGAIVGGLRKKEKFIINGNIENWKKFKAAMEYLDNAADLKAGLKQDAKNIE